MRVDRLKHLIKVLEAVPQDRFDLCTWRTLVSKDKYGVTTHSILVFDETLKNNCGSVACAMGWASADPAFREQGLYYNAGLGTVFFNGFDSYEAAAKFFEITEGTALHLFSPNHYIPTQRDDPAFVIFRIKELVERYENLENA